MRLFLDYQRAEAAGSNRPLFKALNFSPAQIERFTELSVQGMPGNFVGAGGESLRFTVEGDRDEAQRGLRALLGEEGYRKYLESSDTVGPAWQLTTELAGALFDTTAPLTAAQGAQVLGIFTAHRGPVEWSGRPQFDWPAIEAAVERVLTEEQRAAFASYRAADEFQQATVQRRRRTGRPTGTDGAAANPGK